MGMLLVRKRRKVNQEPQTESVNLTEVNGEEKPKRTRKLKTEE